MRNFCASLTLFFCFVAAWSQQNYRFKNINMNAGLSNNTILCINQDSLGRMWFGTYDGLCMYDGENFQSYYYDADSPETSLPDNQVLDIFLDHRSNLWVVLANGCISRLHPVEKGEFKTYHSVSNANYSLTLKGDLLAQLNGKNYLYNYEQDKFVLTHEVCPERDKFSPIRRLAQAQCPEANLLKIHRVSENEFWVASRNSGLFHVYKNVRDTVFQVKRFLHDKLNPSTIASNEVYDVFVDNAGILWVGTKDKGLSRSLLQTSSVTSVAFSQGNRYGLPESPVRALAEASNNELWIGTYDRGVYVYNRHANSYEPLQLPRFNNSDWQRIRSIYKSSEGSMWVGSYGGLLRFNKKKVVRYDTIRLGAHRVQRIYSMVEDSSANLWIGGWDGLDKIDLNTGQLSHVLSAELSDKHIRNLYCDKNNNLWIATEFGGVNVYNIKSGELTVIKNDDKQQPLNCNSIFHITQNHTGDFWISTFKGITVYNPTNRQFKKLQLNLPSNLVYGMLQDSLNNYWIVTGKGVVRFSEDLTKSRVYDNKDGWISTQMSEGAFFKSDSNTLYFGGNEGLNYFKPNELKSNKIPPKSCLFVENECFDKAYNPQVLKLNYFNEGLSLKFQAFHYLEPAKNSIAYRLLPADTVWNYFSGSMATISTASLKPGQYELQYKTANADGLWEKSKKLHIEVEPPFWLQAYFFAGVLLILFIGMLAAFRIRFVIDKNKRKALQALVDERTSRLEEKRKELQCMNEELAESNKNMSEQKNQLSRQHQSLLLLHEQLKEVNEMKMQFFSNLAHEFRTPLTLIAGPVDQLLDDEEIKDTENRDKLIMVKTQSEILIRLVNQLLDFKKLEGGFMKLEKAEGELIPFCQNIVGGFEFEAASKNIELVFSCELKDIYCFFDPEKLRQILVNLLSNAFKFTPSGGKIELLLEIDRREQLVLIKVNDTGIGISKKHIQQIFNRFYQAGASLDYTKPGTGLGLSLCSELIKLHGGEIFVESTENEGSCFTIEFPFEECVLEPESELALQPILPETLKSEANEFLPEKESANKKWVLIVDDHPDIVRHISNILKQDYNILTAFNGKEALKLLKHRTVDLILSDWLMPQMDGISFCENVKTNKKWQQIPLILITALSNDSHRLKAIQRGADDFISKPFSNRLLLAKIENLLQREEALRQTIAIENRLEPSLENTPGSEERMAQKIGELVNEHLSDPEFTSEILGEKMGWSKMQLYRKVKQVTGFTPNELIQTTRLKKGRLLLEDAGNRISEVCFMVGFNDPKYFSRCFLKEFGMQPSAYREQIRREKDNLYVNPN